MQMQPQSVRYLIEFWVVTFPMSICALVRSNWTPRKQNLHSFPCLFFWHRAGGKRCWWPKADLKAGVKHWGLRKTQSSCPKLILSGGPNVSHIFFCLYIWNSIQYRYIDVNKYARLKANFTTKVVSHSHSKCCYNWMFSSLFWLPQNGWWILNKEFGAWRHRVKLRRLDIKGYTITASLRN